MNDKSKSSIETRSDSLLFYRVSLALDLTARTSNYQSIPKLPGAIRSSSNPETLVLEAIEGSYHCSPSARAIDGRRVFILLQEALIGITPNLRNDLNE
ncbi:hypothetical protein Bca4012_068273 [Brassica carinata]